TRSSRASLSNASLISRRRAKQHDATIRPGFCQAGGGVASLRLEAGALDDLAPLLDFLGDELAEVGRCTRQHGAAEVAEPCLHLGIDQRRVDLVVELLDDLGRR